MWLVVDDVIEARVPGGAARCKPLHANVDCLRVHVKVGTSLYL